jgi:CsoR family transcriptional regulator, copper-sensing transcriptional repressor
MRVDSHAADGILDSLCRSAGVAVGVMMVIMMIVLGQGTLPRSAQRRANRVRAHTLPGYLFDTYTLRGYVSIMAKPDRSSRLKRLSRIEGQVRGLARMVEEDRYCIDIITQISAVRAALRRVEEDILRDHIAHCVEHAIVSGNADEQREKIAELMEVLGRSAR